MAQWSNLPHAYRLPPLGETLTCVELVERLRLLWQSCLDRSALSDTLELVIEALGLTAERTEIMGDWPGRDAWDTPRKTRPSPSEIKRRAVASVKVAQLIIAGLEGEPFSWGSGEWQAYSRIARRMGYCLITKTYARRLGYQLRQKARPIGSAYFGSKRYGQVYILECHFKLAQSPKDEAAPDPAEPPTVRPPESPNAKEKPV